MPKRDTQQLRKDMLNHTGYDPTDTTGMNRAERRAAAYALRKKARIKKMKNK